MIAESYPELTADFKRPQGCLPAQDLHELFQLHPHLVNQLLALVQIDLGVITREAIARAPDRETLLIKQASNLTNDQNVLALVVAAVAAPLHGLQLREFLFPIAQHVGFDAAQVADFTDREIALSRDRWQFVIVAWFQHTLRRAPSVFDRDEMSPRAAR